MAGVKFKIGDSVTLVRDKAPKYVLKELDMYETVGSTFVSGKVTGSWSGTYQVTFTFKRKNDQLEQRSYSLPSNCLSNGNGKSSILQLIEDKQKLIQKHQEDIEKLYAKIQLMEELEVEHIDDSKVMLAKKVAKNLNIELKKAYQAIQ